MKTIKLLAIAIFALSLTACQFNQSVNTDLITGASSRGDGIGVKDISVVIAGQPVKRNLFVEGEKINFTFNDLAGLTKENGKFFPGMSIAVLKNEKDTILANPDLFADLKEGTDLSPLQLTGHFRVGKFDVKAKYKVYFKIWDKKGKGTFTYEFPFTVKENKLLQIKSNNLSYRIIYLWNNDTKDIIVDKTVHTKDHLVLILDSVTGLTQVNGKVYPRVAIALVDRLGNKILSSANVLQEYEASGIRTLDFEKGQLPITITFGQGKANNPCKLTTTLTDKNSDKKIDIEAELQVLP